MVGNTIRAGRPGSRRVIDIKAIAMIGVLAAAVAAHWISSREQMPHDLRAFAEKYGPERHSQWGEEWLIRDFFQDKRNGTFVDVGANHYRLFSNTYYLDVVLGWSGLAVEPQVQFADGYTRHRPRTRFRPFFVSDTSDELAKLFVLKANPLVTSADRSFTDRYGTGAEEMTAATTTLNDLLAAEEIDRFDFLNMDIELWEPKALAGLDIQRFQPSLVCIEAHPEVTQEILQYFASNRYVLVAKYLRADEHNLYFTPVQEHTIAGTADR